MTRSETEIAVTVKQPELRGRNGIISEYKLELHEQGDTTTNIIDTIPMVNPDGDVFVFSGLKPFTVYNITIVAKTGAGYGALFHLDVRTIENGMYGTILRTQLHCNENK